VQAFVERCSWHELIDDCGVPRDQIDEAVAMINAAPSAIFMWAMGLTHHAHGTDNVLALGNLALARGFLGKPRCGLMPIRGHSNVQGIGSVGVAPVMKQAFARELSQRYGIPADRAPGLDTYASMRAAHDGQIHAAVLLGGNLWASNPDARWAAEALQRIDTTVSLTTKLNAGHVHGRGKHMVILPVLARDEESQPTSQESMFNYVRMSSGGEPNVAGEMRSEVDVIAQLAARILPDDRFDWPALHSHEDLRDAIAATVPGYAELAENTEFQIPGRTFHTPTFATDSGAAVAHVVPIPDDVEGEFALMTLRSEGQFNSVVYDEEDLYRGNVTRDVVMICAADAQRLAVAEGDWVTVASSIGSMPARIAIVDIAPGSAAMYYPEANHIVPRRIDPKSLTPAFKSIGVTITTV
jgi:molybdopterin-dependent oxidoreductase alpha subunit